MANSPLWQVLWVFAAACTAALMFGAWTGPHRSVSNLSRWAMRLRLRRIPRWLETRAADRWAFRGGLVTIVLLLAIAWLAPSRSPIVSPVGTPDSADADRGRRAGTPAQPAQSSRPNRHIDDELKSAILLHVPKSRQVKLVVLKDDPEADQFSWEIDAFLRAEGYNVVPRVFFAMAATAKPPSGTTLYPDEKDSNVLVIRIGLNDRGL